MRRSCLVILVVLMVPGLAVVAQTDKQPKVQPGPNEPDWAVVLDKMYGLSLFGDLLNPVRTTPEATPGLFRKAGPGPVKFTPVIALGMETITRGGWYTPGPDDQSPQKHELWSYQMKNTAQDLETRANLPPKHLAGSKVEFDPGNAPFGFWVSNDNFPDGGVFSQPRLVAAINQRLAKQPYKAMIYPNKDKATGKPVPHSYIIGWEYSTNDDFQDVVCQVDNAELITTETGRGKKR
jgi:hypothetical protein